MKNAMPAEEAVEMSEGLPLEELRSEHEVVLDVMRQARAEVHSAAADAPAEWGPSADKMLWRLREVSRALLLHFRKEEEALFPDVKATVSEGAPPNDIIAQFFGDQADDDLQAHYLLRQRMDALLRILRESQRAGLLDGESAEQVRAMVDSVADLLGRHAVKESSLIFPMVERLLDEAQMAAVKDRMRAIALALD